MVAETKMSNSTTDTLAPIAVARGTGEVLVDAMTLAELQMQLAELDFYDAKQRLTGGLSLLTAGVVIGASTLPVLLVACGLALSQAAKIDLSLSLFITVGAALLVSLFVLLLGKRKLRFQGVLFQRSRNEWRQNVKWLKAMLRQSGSRHGRRDCADSV